MTRKYREGEELELRVVKIVPGGFGLGFMKDLTVMTALAAPGDLLRVRLTEVKKALAFAEIVEVLERGPGRQKPPCPYFGTCGGCNFQQMTPAAQRESKVAIIEDCLRRIGKFETLPVIPIIASPLDFGYRSRARWHFDRGGVGYLRRDSHEIVDVSECPVVTEELQTVLTRVRGDVSSGRALSDAGEIEAAAAAGQAAVHSKDLAEADRHLVAASGAYEYVYSARTFFQANRALLDALISTAVEGASGARGLDLYSGVGLFTLPLAAKFESVTAVEANGDATEFARLNVRRAGLQNVDIHTAGVGKYLSSMQEPNIDFILLDPPRSGTEDGVIELIARLRPREISYVSCEPSILARDLRKLLGSGYKVDSMVAVDLFPQTHHVETVARLTRM